MASQALRPLSAAVPVPALARIARNRPGILHFRSGLTGDAGTRKALRINALPNPKSDGATIRPTLPRNLLSLKAF